MNRVDKVICTRCGFEGDINDFHKDKDGRNGLYCHCKTCVRESARQYRSKNKEKIRQKSREYRYKNKAKISLRKKQYRMDNAELVKRNKKESYLRNKDKSSVKCREYRSKNKEEIQQRNRQYYLRKKSEEKFQETRLQWRLKNKEKLKLQGKAYYERNKDKIISQTKQYRQENKDRVRLRKKAYAAKHRKHLNEITRQRYTEDMGVRILKNIRNRIYKLLKGGAKSKHTIELLECGVEQFKRYIEKQFKPGMTWDNYGSGMDKWNIDHIIPCNLFQLTDPAEQQQCFHYTNHQPLWENAENGNLQKYNRTHGLNLLYNDPTPFLNHDRGGPDIQR